MQSEILFSGKKESNTAKHSTFPFRDRKKHFFLTVLRGEKLSNRAHCPIIQVFTVQVPEVSGVFFNHERTLRSWSLVNQSGEEEKLPGWPVYLHENVVSLIGICPFLLLEVVFGEYGPLQGLFTYRRLSSSQRRRWLFRGARQSGVYLACSLGSGGICKSTSEAVLRFDRPVNTNLGCV